MRNSWIRMTALGGSLLFGAAVSAGPPQAATISDAPVAQSAAISPAEREGQVMMERLAKANDALLQKVEAADSWRYQIQQAEILLQLAGRSTNGGECDKWLEMAIVSYAAAAGQCPANDTSGYKTLALLPDYIAKNFPNSKHIALAVAKEIEADTNRVQAKDGVAAGRQHHRNRLLEFAVSYPQLPEAPLAILKAAQISEQMDKTDEACVAYRKLSEAYPGKDVARKAREALARLGGIDGTVVEFTLPLLYPAHANVKPFDLKDVRGKGVLVHFWSSSSPDVAESFQALKRLTDRGMEVVYVNLDGDVAKAKAFLSGQLTAGTHVFDPKGDKSELMDRYGVDKLPQTFLVDGKGGLVKHSLQSTRLEQAVGAYLPYSRR